MTVSYHQLLAAGLCGSALICQQCEGFRLGGLQLLLLRESHGVEARELLSLELWHLERFLQKTGILVVTIN